VRITVAAQCGLEIVDEEKKDVGPLGGFPGPGNGCGDQRKECEDKGKEVGRTAHGENLEGGAAFSPAKVQ